MKIIGTIGLAAAVTFTSLQSAAAYPRGGGGHYSGGGHFSAARSSGGAHYSGGSRGYSGPSRSYAGPSRSYSGPSRGYAGPSRNYSNVSARSYGATRVNSTALNRNNVSSQSRYSAGTTGYRNPTYTSGARRFNGDRTTAFNSRTYSRSNARLANGNRTAAARSQGFNGGNVIARHNANNWHRNWDRGRDHHWNGHRCHYNNGYWFIYDPFPYYYGYGFYPYGGYYDPYYYGSGYYDDGSYATDESVPATHSNQQEYQTDSQVSNVQSALAREGYYDGAIDGRFGPRTRTALRRYQRDHRLDATGEIDNAVIDALRLR